MLLALPSDMTERLSESRPLLTCVATDTQDQAGTRSMTWRATNCMVTREHSGRCTHTHNVPVLLDKGATAAAIGDLPYHLIAFSLSCRCLLRLLLVFSFRLCSSPLVTAKLLFLPTIFDAAAVCCTERSYNDVCTEAIAVAI